MVNFNGIEESLNMGGNHHLNMISDQINAYVIDLDNCVDLIKDFEEFSGIIFNVLDVLNDVEEDELEDYTP